MKKLILFIVLSALFCGGLAAFAAQSTILGTDTVKDSFLTKINAMMTELYAIASEVEAGRDGESSILDKMDSLDTSIAALTAGSGCPVSANDTTAGYLNGKLIVGSGITFTENSDGGNETLSIATTFATSAETITGTSAVKTVNPADLTEALRAKFLL